MPNSDCRSWRTVDKIFLEDYILIGFILLNKSHKILRLSPLQYNFNFKTMQIFQETQRNFGYLGINAELEPLNRRVLVVLAIAYTCILSDLIFLIYGPHSSQEYMESIYIITSSCGTTLSYVNTIFIRNKLFSFIKNVNKFLSESK